MIPVFSQSGRDRNYIVTVKGNNTVCYIELNTLKMCLCVMKMKHKNTFKMKNVSNIMFFLFRYFLSDAPLNVIPHVSNTDYDTVSQRKHDDTIDTANCIFF